MIITLTSLLIVGIVFLVLSYGLLISWYIFLPVCLALIIVRLFRCNLRNLVAAKLLLFKRPDLFTPSQTDMLLASPSIFMPSSRTISDLIRFDYSAALTIATFLSLVYAVLCLILQQWLPVLLSLLTFILPILLDLRGAFETSNRDENIKRAATRCLKKTEKFPDSHNPASDPNLDYFTDDYNSIMEKMIAQKK